MRLLHCKHNSQMRDCSNNDCCSDINSENCSLFFIYRAFIFANLGFLLGAVVTTIETIQTFLYSVLCMNESDAWYLQVVKKHIDSQNDIYIDP